MSTLETLVSMGFPEKTASKAIEVTGNKGVEEAMEWLLAHSDDLKPSDTTGNTLSLSSKKPEETEAKEEASAAPAEGAEPKSEAMETDDQEKKSAEEAAKSIKCDECGKLFKTSEEVEFHAVKSGHASFSESTEEKAPLTEEQKKQKLIELEEKLKERRRAKAAEEEKEAREKERKRIEMGKTMAEIKRKKQEDEIRKIAEEKRREKIEDKMARQRVKDQIEADKEARRQKLAAARGETPAVVAATPVSTPAPVGVKKTYDEARIQFRLPSGPPVVQSFKSKEPLSAVKLWLSLNHPPADPSLSTTLSTTFPRKIFSEEDMDAPLDVLGLVPSSVLMVQYK